MFYLGTGTKFKKEDCKEYKTKDGALKALAKHADGVVWDADGAVVAYEMNGTVTVAGGQQDAPQAATEGENEPEAVKNTPDEENAHNGAKDAHEDGQQDATQTAGATGGQQDALQAVTEGENEPEAVKNTPDEENANNEAQGKPQRAHDVIVPQGQMKATVICDGSLNLRRSASWDNENICGRASRGQSYHVKAIHMVDGKRMIETIDGIFLSGEGNLVQFEQL